MVKVTESPHFQTPAALSQWLCSGPEDNQAVNVIGSVVIDHGTNGLSVKPVSATPAVLQEQVQYL